MYPVCIGIRARIVCNSAAGRHRCIVLKVPKCSAPGAQLVCSLTGHSHFYNHFVTILEPKPAGFWGFSSRNSEQHEKKPTCVSYRKNAYETHVGSSQINTKFDWKSLQGLLAKGSAKKLLENVIPRSPEAVLVSISNYLDHWFCRMGEKYPLWFSNRLA